MKKSSTVKEIAVKICSTAKGILDDLPASVFIETPADALPASPSNKASMGSGVGGGGRVGGTGERDVTTAWRILHTAAKLDGGDVGAVDR